MLNCNALIHIDTIAAINYVALIGAKDCFSYRFLIKIKKLGINSAKSWVIFNEKKQRGGLNILNVEKTRNTGF